MSSSFVVVDVAVVDVVGVVGDVDDVDVKKR